MPATLPISARVLTGIVAGMSNSGYLGSGGITMNCHFFEALLLGRLGLLSRVSAPVAVLTE
jgi:hypothetical protein